MSHLGEDAEAFFKKGDEGTYEGGPSSIMPSSRDCPDAVEEDENPTTELIAGQLERRSRMQRLVTKIVGGLGVGVLLLVPVRLRASSAAGVAAAKPGAPVATAPVTTAHPAPEAPSDKTDGIGVRVTSEGRRPHGTAVHSQQQGNRRAVRMTRPTRTLAPPPPSNGRRFPDSHAPPTAIFPD